MSATPPSFAPILEKIGSNPNQESLLDLFLEYVNGLGLNLYPAQEEAILELFSHHHVILNTPTGSGKSLVAMAMAFMAMAEKRRFFYTCPIKALVNEKFFALCDAFGADKVGLLTGDGAVNSAAPLICCTAEVLSNMAIGQRAADVSYVVMDEFHFYGDKERGAAWHIPLITMENCAFLLMSATLGDTDNIAESLENFSGRAVSKVSGGERPVPLEFSYEELTYTEAVMRLFEDNKAPIYLVNFTQRNCAERAQGLTSLPLLDKETRKKLSESLHETRFDTPYGKELRRFLQAGVGVHHAGLLPKYRFLVEKLAQKGFLKVVSGTDSLGVGVNIPIRTVLFSQLCKYDGTKSALLSARQFHQIAGRAGRRGFDDKGYVVAIAPEHIVENRRIEAKIVKDPNLKRKLVKKTPPKFGYVPWDEAFFQKIIAAPPEALTPVLNIDHAMVLTAIQNGGASGYSHLIEIIRRSHLTQGQKRFQIRRAATLAKSLLAAEVVQIVADPAKPGSKTFRVRPDFQEDFSLNQTLSLFLVKAADLLNPESENYALDLLSLVEAICENPEQILARQLDKLKSELMNQMKAEGVPYEERISRLEEVQYEKPNAEALYTAFNEFRQRHPWTSGNTVQPKSIARDLFERSMDFNYYVDYYGLERLEGLLLRYLSDVVKTAERNIPQKYIDERMAELISYLRTMVRRVDSTLLDEWEERLAPGERPVRAAEKLPPPPVDIAKNRQEFFRRLRAETRMLLTAIAKNDYEATVLALRPDSAPFKNSEEFKAFMAPYYTEYPAINYLRKALLSEYTVICETGPREWTITQALLDNEGATEFALAIKVNLNSPYDPDLPVLELIELKGDL